MYGAPSVAASMRSMSFPCWCSASTTTGASRPCVTTWRLISARFLSGALASWASISCGVRRASDARFAVAKVSVMQETCTYSSISLVVMPTFARARIGGHERRAGESLVDVMHDHRRLDDDHAVMDDRRHHGVGIELHVAGVELVAPQRQQPAVEANAFFHEREPRLDRADRCAAMVEREHVLGALPCMRCKMDFQIRVDDTITVRGCVGRWAPFLNRAKLG